MSEKEIKNRENVANKRYFLKFFALYGVEVWHWGHLDADFPTSFPQVRQGASNTLLGDFVPQC